MYIKTFDRSCLRAITDETLAPPGTDGYKHPLGFYFNDRVLKSVHFNVPRLVRVQGPERPSSRGYVAKYYCPVCGRPMWCTYGDLKQPAITCRKCHSDEVEELFGTTLAEKASWAYVTMLSDNYDPLTPGDATIEGKVCAAWKNNPLVFVRWLKTRLAAAMSKSRYDGYPVWLVARGDKWDATAKLSRELSPRGKRIKVI